MYIVCVFNAIKSYNLMFTQLAERQQKFKRSQHDGKEEFLVERKEGIKIYEL